MDINSTKNNLRNGEQKRQVQDSELSNFATKKSEKRVKFIFEITFKYILLLFLLFVTAIAVFFIFFRPSKVVSVPNVVGKQFIEAVILLQEKDMFVRVQEQYTSDPSSVGRVLQQQPKAGTPVRNKRSVVLMVSKGANVSSVPNIVGVSLDRARDIIKQELVGLENLLTIASIHKVYSDDKVGLIITQNPRDGAKISNSGEKLNITISRGTVETEGTMFDMLDLNFLEVMDFLEKRGKKFSFYLSKSQNPTELEQEQYYLKSGVIIEQSPAPGSDLTNQDIIRIGIRPYLMVQTDFIGNKPKEKPSNYIVEVASIPSGTFKGPITIMQTKDEESTHYITVSEYGETITFPYIKEEGVAYEATDKDGNSLWFFAVTSQK